MTRQLKPWAYGPFEVLLHAVVGGQGVGAEDVTAGRLAARERGLAAGAERGDQVRVERRIKCREREVVRLRRQAFDREIEVAIERALDRVIECQLDSNSGRWRSNGGSRLFVRLCLAG